MLPNTHTCNTIHTFCNYAQYWILVWLLHVNVNNIARVHGVAVYIHVMYVTHLWASPKLVNATLALCCISYTPTLQNTCPKSDKYEGGRKGRRERHTQRERETERERGGCVCVFVHAVRIHNYVHMYIMYIIMYMYVSIHVQFRVPLCASVIALMLIRKLLERWAIPEHISTTNNFVIQL